MTRAAVLIVALLAAAVAVPVSRPARRVVRRRDFETREGAIFAWLTRDVRR